MPGGAATSRKRWGSCDAKRRERIMPRKSNPDFLLLVLVTALVGVGVVMIYSASAIVALRDYKTPYYYLQRQLLWAAIGAFALWVGLRIDYRNYRHFAVIIASTAVALLLAVLAPPFGGLRAGVRRWIEIGPLTLQPSELAKPALIIFLAHVLVKKKDQVQKSVLALAPELIFLALCLLLIMFEPDLGTAVTLGATMAALLFVGGIKKRDLLLAGLFAFPAVIYSIAQHPYQRARVMSFIDPWKDPFGDGFQIIQSFLALGRGGVLGLGPAASRQKLFFLPAPHTDFVLAVIGEELGFAGLAVVMLLLGMILWRGVRIALRAPDLFGTYLAFGLTFSLFLQAVLNAGVVAGLLPTKGMTMPFLSYGGTSLVISLAGIGILLNISLNGVPAGAK
jgi:cell division protein FtsW